MFIYKKWFFFLIFIFIFFHNIMCKEKWLKQNNFDSHWKTTKANYVTSGVRGMMLFRRNTAWRKLWRSKLSFRQSFVFELKYWVASMLCGLQLPTFNNDSVSDVINKVLVSVLVRRCLLWFYWCRMHSEDRYTFSNV